MELRPIKHLRAVMRDYPELGPWVDMLRWLPPAAVAMRTTEKDDL